MDILVRTKRREGGKGSVMGARTSPGFFERTLKTFLEICLHHDLSTVVHPQILTPCTFPDHSNATYSTLGRKNIDDVGF